MLDRHHLRGSLNVTGKQGKLRSGASRGLENRETSRDYVAHMFVYVYCAVLVELNIYQFASYHVQMTLEHLQFYQPKEYPV
ncbi:hypothetical protein PspLS_00856 [Pyricularia sp. CBS 133598]|nr:hypothetical protein PspLS_00856 [Pyricularia sp. CBS 133598]